MMGQSETLSSSQIQFITFFYACSHRVAVRFTTATCAITLSQNHFLEPNCGILTFLHSNFSVQDRITYDHPWRCSYKIVNQACYNMVPNLLVQCKLCDSSTTESQWGSKGLGTCGCVGSHNQTFTSSQLTWNSPNRFGYCFHSAWFHKFS
jgi:hypothetical protein